MINNATIYATKLAAIQANVEAAYNAGMNMTTTIYMHPRVDHEDGRSALLDNTGTDLLADMALDGWQLDGWLPEV